MSTTYPHHLYSHLHYPHQRMTKNQVPSITSWRITLDQSASHSTHHHHQQGYSIDLGSYLMFLHLLLKLHLQCSTLMTIIAPQIWHILSQPDYAQLITPPSGTRKHAKNQFKIDRSSQASHIQPFTTSCPSSQSMEPIAHVVFCARYHLSD
jgi:hypothetical protein